MNPKQIVIFGGSFDPIHQGHLAVAKHLQILGLSNIIFLPCGRPALKNECAASANDRLEMLKLALDNQKGFEIDVREINRPGSSYAIDTLKSFRKQYGPLASLSFIIGEDAFAHLMEWHQWESILNYAHIINHTRPNLAHAYPKKLQEYLKSHQCQDLQIIKQKAHGHIFCLELPNFPYSSTAIKHAIQNKKSPEGLEPKVLNYIEKKKLYGFNI